jgi:hypothetical protein
VLESEEGDPETAGYLDRLQAVVANVPPPGPIADYVFLCECDRAGRPEQVTTAAWRRRERRRRSTCAPSAQPRPPAVRTKRPGADRRAGAEAEAAGALYGAIESQRGTASFFVPLTLDRLLGLLAATFGDFEAATAHFEAGLVFCERAGYGARDGHGPRTTMRRRCAGAAGLGDDKKAAELEKLRARSRASSRMRV